MAQKIMISTFIDTSAFKAVFDDSDDFHMHARKFWQKALSEQIHFITTNFILDETYTLFRSHLGKEKSLIFRDKLAASPKSIRVISVQQKDEAIAWEYFERLPGRGVSFTDCTSFSVMKRLNLQYAFTFDSDFTTAGFIISPNN